MLYEVINTTRWPQSARNGDRLHQRTDVLLLQHAGALRQQQYDFLIVCLYIRGGTPQGEIYVLSNDFRKKK